MVIGADYIGSCKSNYHTITAGCPLSFETGGTMGYNCCFFLNFVPLHIESPYNFGGTGPILGVKNPLQRVNGHAVTAMTAPWHYKRGLHVHVYTALVSMHVHCIIYFI